LFATGKIIFGELLYGFYAVIISSISITVLYTNIKKAEDGK